MIKLQWVVRAWVRLMLALAAGASLVGCSAFSDKPKPVALEPAPTGAPARLLWSAADGRVSYPLQVGLAAGRVATAASDGAVTVRTLNSGSTVWSAKVGAALSAGVGFDGERAAVVTQGNELVLLAEGRALWRKRLTSRASTAPLVAGERVFVLGLDRSVEAYDAIDGRYLWRLQRAGDPLSVQINGVLLAVGDTLVVGQGPRLVGIDPTKGLVRWDLPLATPRGTNEVERLADLVGPAVRMGEVVCARAFQSAVSCADVGRNVLRWTRNIGGVQSVGGTERAVVGADASDRMTAWKSDTGELLWSHERFLHRDLSGLAGWKGWVAAGDLQGFVHVLDAATGNAVMRLRTDDSPVEVTPRVAGDVLVVVTRKGGVFAWQAP